MSKLGVITDGISRDFEHALKIMTEFELEYAELQFLWDKEVGDLEADQMAKTKALVKEYGVKVSCISRHNFAGMLVGETEVGDPNHTIHMDALQRCINMAQELDCRTVRIMCFRREMILFGKGGADNWVVATGAWDKLKELLAPAVELAEKEGVTLVLENGNGLMVPSAWLGRKLVDEMGSEHLKILWDPGNGLYATEKPFPDAYEALRGGALGHYHIKDAIVDMPKATVEFCEMGTGQLASSYEPTAQAFKEDGYDGVISLESVYCPEGGTFEDGFRASVGLFKRVFG
jgi:sugar phosphate isomerase/epimerase